MTAVVLDASVAVKWFLRDELDIDRAVAFRDAVVAGTVDASVPPHFGLEVAGALVRAARRGRFDGAALGPALRALGDLPLTMVRPADLEAPAAVLAMEDGLHPMDAAYLILAAHLGAPLVTADGRLREVARVHGRDVLWLGDLPVDPMGAG